MITPPAIAMMSRTIPRIRSTGGAYPVCIASKPPLGWASSSAHDLERVRSHDHGVRHLDDLGGGEARRAGVPPDRLGARSLVDAHGAQGAAGLLGHVAADPPDFVRHLLSGCRGSLSGVRQI